MQAWFFENFFLFFCLRLDLRTRYRVVVWDLTGNSRKTFIIILWIIGLAKWNIGQAFCRRDRIFSLYIGFLLKIFSCLLSIRIKLFLLLRSLNGRDLLSHKIILRMLEKLIQSLLVCLILVVQSLRVCFLHLFHADLKHFSHELHVLLGNIGRHTVHQAHHRIVRHHVLLGEAVVEAGSLRQLLLLGYHAGHELGIVYALIFNRKVVKIWLFLILLFKILFFRWFLFVEF